MDIAKAREKLLRQNDWQLRWKLTAVESPKTRQKVAWDNWLYTTGYDWRVACCWHVPQSMRNEQSGHSKEWLARQLSAYFNTLDKRIYKKIPVSKRPRLPRFIVLERSAGVGWHAHGLMENPPHLSRDELTALLADTWENRVGRYCDGIFDRHLFWCEQRDRNYAQYSIKSAIELEGYNVDGVNGYIDLKNTYVATRVPQQVAYKPLAAVA